LDSGFVAYLETAFEVSFTVFSRDLVALRLAPTLAAGLAGLTICLLSIDLERVILGSTLGSSFFTGLEACLAGALVSFSTLLAGFSSFLAG